MYVRLLLFYFSLALLCSPSISSGQVNPGDAGFSGAELKISRFIVTLNGGLGYLTGSTKAAKTRMRNMGVPESDMDHYFRDFKTGGIGMASVHYMVNPALGLGVDYNIFTTRGQVRGYLDPGDGWSKFYGIFSDKVYTNFIGASGLTREKISAHWGYYSKISLGMALYRDEASLINTPILITGKSFALCGESGLTYSISRHVSVNTGLSYFLSKLGKISSSDGTDTVETKLEKDSQENLSRLNLSAGLSLNF